MDNRFFDIALNRASGLLGKRGRLLMLLANMTRKLQTVKWKDVKASSVKENFFTLGRMVKAYAFGRYREVPWKTMLLVVATILYFVNPIDLIPDWIPALGLTDDAGILMSVYASLTNEVDKFLSWEKARALQQPHDSSPDVPNPL